MHGIDILRNMIVYIMNMGIHFQGDHDIKLSVTEHAIYIGETVDLRCRLLTKESISIYTLIILICDPCSATGKGKALNSSKNITWKTLESGEQSTELTYRWTANETFSPLIVCRVMWNGPRHNNYKEDTHHLNIKGELFSFFYHLKANEVLLLVLKC